MTILSTGLELDTLAFGKHLKGCQYVHTCKHVWFYPYIHIYMFICYTLMRMTCIAVWTHQPLRLLTCPGFPFPPSLPSSFLLPSFISLSLPPFFLPFLILSLLRPLSYHFLLLPFPLFLFHLLYPLSSLHTSLLFIPLTSLHYDSPPHLPAFPYPPPSPYPTLRYSYLPYLTQFILP